MDFYESITEAPHGLAVLVACRECKIAVFDVVVDHREWDGSIERKAVLSSRPCDCCIALKEAKRLHGKDYVAAVTVRDVKNLGVIIGHLFLEDDTARWFFDTGVAYLKHRSCVVGTKIGENQMDIHDELHHFMKEHP